MNIWTIFKQITFLCKKLAGATLWHLLETIWLLFIQTSGHTPCDHKVLGSNLKPNPQRSNF